MTLEYIYNQLATNMSVWGIFFLIGTGIWMLALSQLDKKVSKK